MSGKYIQVSCEDLLYKHKNSVYKLALARTKSKHDAEDVFQNVFVRLIKYQPVFENETHEKAWFIRVTINCCNNLFTEPHYGSSQELDENIRYEDEIKDDTVLLAVLSLPEKYRVPIHLFYYEDLPINDIAAAINEKVNTVKSYLHRGKSMLREILKKDVEL